MYFSRIKSTIKSLCSPALFYFTLSCLFLVATIIQNAGNSRKYCIGYLECNVANNALVFLMKIIYIVFWTFILDYICKSGYTNISWFIVLLPFISLFILLIGMVFLINKGECIKLLM